MGWDMIDETAIKQCHSQTVGHGMRHDWWDCNKAVSLTYCWSSQMRHDWWDCNKAVSLTFCWSLDETQLMRLIKMTWQRNHMVQMLTLYQMCLWDCLEKFAMKLLPVFHVIRVLWKTRCTVTYFLTYTEMTYKILLINSVTHSLFVTEWDTYASWTGANNITYCLLAMIWDVYEMHINFFRF